MYNVVYLYYVILLYNIICNKFELEFKNIIKNIIILNKYNFVKINCNLMDLRICVVFSKIFWLGLIVCNLMKKKFFVSYIKY